jgi:hypothetical protein
VVSRVPHIDISTTIHGYSLRVIKCRDASPHAIGKGREAPSASQGGHCTKGGNFTDAVVRLVCHIHHPRRVYCEANGIVKACRSTLPICPSITAISCKCGSHSRGRELSNAVVAQISNVDDARARVRCNTIRVIKTRCSPSTISPRSPPFPRGRSTPCKGAHKARGCHCPDAVVAGVCHIHYPRDVFSHASRFLERSRSPLAIGKAIAAAPRQGCCKPHTGGLCTQPLSTVIGRVTWHRGIPSPRAVRSSRAGNRPTPCAERACGTGTGHC